MHLMNKKYLNIFEYLSKNIILDNIKNSKDKNILILWLSDRHQLFQCDYAKVYTSKMN